MKTRKSIALRRNARKGVCQRDSVFFAPTHETTQRSANNADASMKAQPRRPAADDHGQSGTRKKRKTRLRGLFGGGHTLLAKHAGYVENQLIVFCRSKTQTTIRHQSSGQESVFTTSDKPGISRAPCTQDRHPTNGPGFHPQAPL